MTLVVTEGWLWPESDRHLWAVARDYTVLEKALGYLTQRRSVIQAGGACGTFPFWLAKHFKAVYTFEPDPENFTCLAANAQQANVIKFQCALGQDSRSVSLQRDKLENVGMSYVVPGADVRMIAGDMLELRDVDLIQLDVEGMEYEALQGLKQTVEKSSPLIVIEEKHAERYGRDKGVTSLWLNSLGYQQVGKYSRDLIFKRA